MRYAIREEAIRRHEETQKRLEALRKNKEISATLIQVLVVEVLRDRGRRGHLFLAVMLRLHTV